MHSDTVPPPPQNHLIPAFIQEEEALLEAIRERLISEPPAAGANPDDIVEEMQRLQQEMRAAKTEDKAAIEQQYNLQGRVLEQIRKGKQEARVNPENPYFAHMTVRAEGRTTDVYLGKCTRISDGVRIVDWRHAPIARIFYRYQEGDDYTEVIGERDVEGVVKVRRTLSVVDGHLQRIAAAQGTFVRSSAGWEEHRSIAPQLATGAGAQRASTAGPARLGTGKAHRADKHLPDIAALIDPEQFELISKPDAGPVVIRGGAGSGKTTVALHRIAWLAFNTPSRFAPSKMLVVVWGRALRDYVSKVLPGLGVEGVPVVTWSDWSRKAVARHYPRLPNHDNASTPGVVSRLKLHPGLHGLLERVVRTRKAAATGTGALDDWKHLLSDRTLLAELDGFTEDQLDECMRWASKQQHQMQLLEDRERGAEPWLDEEDDAILLRAWQLRVGDLRSNAGAIRLAHIAIDEVQDFSPMEVAVLLGACDKAKCITLAGDTQQHISASGGSLSWTDLLASLGVKATALSNLKVSYRSTRTITAFARGILGHLAEDEAPALTMREGEPVPVFDFPDHGAAVDFLGRALRALMQDEPNASVAVLTPTPTMAETYFNGFDRMDVPEVRLIEDQSFTFSPGVDVVDVAQVKGLEFDYVILVDVSAAAYPNRDYPRRLLHVAATRAIHQLWVTYVGSPSPVLLQALDGVGAPLGGEG
ncbi:MAG: DNA helicase UvrD [Myxococcales bacterium]|nr:DNA helicase UvrD [Myxococcales bacterium]